MIFALWMSWWIYSGVPDYRPPMIIALPSPPFFIDRCRFQDLWKPLKTHTGETGRSTALPWSAARDHRPKEVFSSPWWCWRRRVSSSDVAGSHVNADLRIFLARIDIRVGSPGDPEETRKVSCSFLYMLHCSHAPVFMQLLFPLRHGIAKW